MDRLPIAICSGSDNEGNIRIGYTLLALTMQGRSSVCSGYDVYVNDNGLVPLTSSRWVMLLVDLLIKGGHSFHYIRDTPGRGLGYYKSSIIQESMKSGVGVGVLCLDDDLIPMPGSIDTMLGVAANLRYNGVLWGFISGTKIELDPHKSYKHDLNEAMNAEGDGSVKRIFYGDGAYTLISYKGLQYVDWSLVEKYSMPGLTGEDTRYSSMIVDKLPCFGAGAAYGYHLALANARWEWEAPTDILMTELLKDKVSRDTIGKVFPYLKDRLDG